MRRVLIGVAFLLLATLPWLVFNRLPVEAQPLSQSASSWPALAALVHAVRASSSADSDLGDLISSRAGTMHRDFLLARDRDGSVRLRRLLDFCPDDATVLSVSVEKSSGEVFAATIDVGITRLDCTTKRRDGLRMLQVLMFKSSEGRWGIGAAKFCDSQ